MLNLDTVDPRVDLNLVWGARSEFGDEDGELLLSLSGDLQDSLTEVLLAHGIEPREGSVVADLTIITVIGFVGPGLVGSLGLATSEQTLERLHRRDRGRDSDDCDRGDWLRELANQVLGRLKAHLLFRGLRIRLALPQSIRGMRLSPDQAQARRLSWSASCGDDGPLLAWLELERSEGLRACPGPPIRALSAGQVAFF